MKKIRGIKLVVVGLFFYLPYFIWGELAEEVPKPVFWVCSALFVTCALVGFLQSFCHKDDELDDDLQRTMQEKKVQAGKKGWMRLG